MAAWDDSLEPEVAAQIRALFEQKGMTTSDGEPDWDAARQHVLSKYIGGGAARIDNDADGAIIKMAATGPRLFDSLFDAVMCTSAGVGDEAIEYVRRRLIGFMSPSGTAQKLANSMGTVLCEISAQDPNTLERHSYRFTTGSPVLAVKYFARPAADKLRNAHKKTNDKADIVLGVFDDEETKAAVRTELLKAVIKGIPFLGAGSAKNVLLGEKPLKEIEQEYNL